MVTVLRLHLPSDIPIVGCELTPYVLLKRADKSHISDDITEYNPIDGHFLRYKWYRIQKSDKNVAVCNVHPTEQATLQCLGCLKAKLPVPVAKSYHCSPQCFLDAWPHHRVLHERAASALNENRTEEEIFSRFNSSGSNASLSTSQSNPNLSNASSGLYPTAVTQRNGDEMWVEVAYSKMYTPTADDVGHVLKFECIVVDAETKSTVGPHSILSTSLVIPAPSPIPRRVIPVGMNVYRNSVSDGHNPLAGTFSVLSYNILSDAHATNELYGYCPTWALSWPYRRQNLLREIVGYRADIVCLQEVQFNHFEEFFAPELNKHGYQAMFKKKTTEIFVGPANNIDGCATFFRRDRFSHVKKYEVEFNKAAQSLTDALVPSAQKKNALSRLIKDNVALILVLEAKFGNQGVDNPGKRQLICVANTHINVQTELKDVKLWQVQTLLKGLEKIAVSADIPMLVCGDFNSVPGSAPHALLVMGKVDTLHQDLAIDPMGINRPYVKLVHQLPLVSAYTSFARVGSRLGLEQRKKTDPATNEPLFTNCTRDFIGTHDYIFYSADTLTVVSLLELLDEKSVRKDTALPSPEWSSDHIALYAEFRCKPRTRR